MKITVLAENFRKALGVVVKGVALKPQLPILSGVLIRVENGEVSLTGTDLEISFWVSMKASVEREGEIVVPAKLLMDLISGLPAGPMSLEVVEGHKIELSAKGVKAEIVGQSVDDFPGIPRMGKTELVIDGGEFKKSLGRVMVAVARDESRPVLTGVLWDINSDGAKLVATDGFRLAIDRIVMKGGKEERVVVPARVLGEIVKAIGELSVSKVMVQIDKENSQIIFGLGEAEVTSRLLSGDFPPYQQIMPNTYNTQVHLDRVEMLEAVKRAGLFAKEVSNIVKMELVEGTLVVKAESSQSGKSQTELKVEKEGGDVTVAFNARYIIDALSSGGDKVVWETEGELRPSVFKVEGDESWVQVVMPVRLT